MKHGRAPPRGGGAERAARGRTTAGPGADPAKRKSLGFPAQGGGGGGAAPPPPPPRRAPRPPPAPPPPPPPPAGANPSYKKLAHARACAGGDRLGWDALV